MQNRFSVGVRMLSLVLRIVIPIAVIVSVSEIAERSPRLGAVLVAFPLVSLLAFGAAWFQSHDLRNLSSMARDTLILVPLGLPFFVPLAFAERLGLGFWAAAGLGLLAGLATTATWLVLTSSVR
jgi:hypothetical protein